MLVPDTIIYHHKRSCAENQSQLILSTTAKLWNRLQECLVVRQSVEHFRELILKLTYLSIYNSVVLVPCTELFQFSCIVLILYFEIILVSSYQLQYPQFTIILKFKQFQFSFSSRTKNSNKFSLFLVYQNQIKTAVLKVLIVLAPWNQNNTNL